MNHFRRTLFHRLPYFALGFCGLIESRFSMSQSQAEYDDLMRRAREGERAIVEDLYSTKPVRVRLGDREFNVPVNYITPKGRNERESLEAEQGIAIVLFLPDFGGFTKSNWEKGWFDKRRIDVLKLSATYSHRTPRTIFGIEQRSLEANPFVAMHGLTGFRWKSKDMKGAVWTGTDRAGDFFMFETSDIPGEPLPFADTYPLCKVRYYRSSERLFVAYQYSMDQFAKWAEIDQGIWNKLNTWKSK